MVSQTVYIELYMYGGHFYKYSYDRTVLIIGARLWCLLAGGLGLESWNWGSFRVGTILLFQGRIVPEAVYIELGSTYTEVVLRRAVKYEVVHRLWQHYGLIMSLQHHFYTEYHTEQNTFDASFHLHDEYYHMIRALPQKKAQLRSSLRTIHCVFWILVFCWNGVFAVFFPWLNLLRKSSRWYSYVWLEFYNSSMIALR